MNYITLINQFWQIRRSKRITSLQADLYYFLLQESNVRNWDNPFEVSNKLICASIGISEPSLIDARNRLQQLGLIEFSGGKRNSQSPIYYIKDYLNHFSRNRTESLVETEQEVKLKGEPINKLNKTKKNSNSFAIKKMKGENNNDFNTNRKDEYERIFQEESRGTTH